ncbi:acyltransferase family protein [Williamsia maris]|uniref:Peptidoglycan/LPS O-acetylase OafA/YrhL, contains acyltransferase and SGNH-hydrolase domains n=1 Tax=Williamsia maris TaxID=72806 RepID=A0ABT1HGS3_9NOCA|nr:Peptidoglycan/LPS O-acetylase OafA/YrhL, contains acyltransferase and SGNH-hydrolase domains [Williamsia maris]
MVTAPSRSSERQRTVPADPASAYRTDLDGLRGIAITLVACFHIWFGRVSGGVDVFLTLSGYFFVGSLLKHVIVTQSPSVTLRDAINPLTRLTRLARRLLPALITVLLIVTVLTIVVLPQTRWVATGREVVASALYYQNWFLAFNSQDYAAASSANSPLQHLWSMSVQGQFFVVTILTALAFGGVIKLASTVVPQLRRPAVIRAIVATAIIGVAAVSFYWAHMRMPINQQFNYYDTIARTWEPLAGGLLAVWMPRWRVPTVLRNLVAVAALALIVTCGWWIVGVESYPGPLALVPVLATLAIIWSGATATQRGTRVDMPVINRGLASRFPVWLGSISYALYLWHWPLLIFYLAWRDSNDATFVEGVLLIALSIALAWLTKRYVEDPLRSSRPGTKKVGQHRADGAATSDSLRDPVLPTRSSRGRRARAAMLSYTGALTTLLVVGVLVAGVGIKAWERHVDNIVVDTTNLDPRIYPGARALIEGVPVPSVDPVPKALEVLKDLPETSYQGNISDFKDPDIHVAVYGDPTATKTIALAGGSHAEYWISALDLLGKQNHFRVTTYLKFGCPLSVDPNVSVDGVPYPACRTWVERVMDRLIADKPDAVFTNSTRPRQGIVGEWVPPDYLPIFDRFKQAGIPVLGVRDSVWPHNGKGAIDSPTCLAEGGDAKSCGTPRDPEYGMANPTDAIVADYPNVHPIDLSRGWCTDTLCPAIIGNISVYHDWHHLSATFVRSLAPELERQMKLVFPWA